MTATTEWGEGHFIAGDAALDFANTVYRRWPEPGADLFTNPEALGTWLTHADLQITGIEPSIITDAELDQARALRALLWRVFDAQRGGLTIPAEAFADVLGTARRGITRVTMNADGSMTSHDVDGALTTLALRVTGLVLDPPAAGVRACDRCGWFFIDASRGRRRRWCSMKICGNQAKAARYRSTRS